MIDKTACCQKFYFTELMQNLIKGPSCHAKVVDFRFHYNKFDILIFFITILHGNMFSTLRSYHNIKKDYIKYDTICKTIQSGLHILRLTSYRWINSYANTHKWKPYLKCKTFEDYVHCKSSRESELHKCPFSYLPLENSQV